MKPPLLSNVRNELAFPCQCWTEGWWQRRNLCSCLMWVFHPFKCSWTCLHSSFWHLPLTFPRMFLSTSLHIIPGWRPTFIKSMQACWLSIPIFPSGLQGLLLMAWIKLWTSGRRLWPTWSNTESKRFVHSADLPQLMSHLHLCLCPASSLHYTHTCTRILQSGGFPGAIPLSLSSFYDYRAQFNSEECFHAARDQRPFHAALHAGRVF